MINAMIGTEGDATTKALEVFLVKVGLKQG
jgi:hypothetical protein